MSNSLNFEKMKINFSSILTAKLGDLSKIDELHINYARNINERFETRLKYVNQTILLLEAAQDENDELATQAALLRLRSHSMGFADFFNAIVNDIDVMLNKSTWQEFPEDYKIPEHYNFAE